MTPWVNRHAHQRPLLLDLLPDPTIVALAVSTRLLTRRYKGPCMLVRRASDSATLDIPFCKGWACFRTLAAFCSGTTGQVRTWYDQSGNGTNVEQSTAASQPTIFSSGNLQRDAYGNPRIFHNATGEIFTFSATGLPQSNSPVTNISVYRRDNTSGVRSRWSYGTNVAGQYRGLESDNGLFARVNNGSTNAALSTAENSIPIVSLTRFAAGGNTMSLRNRFDNASNTVQSNSTTSTFTTGSTFGKIWGRPADTTSATGYSYEHIFMTGNIVDALALVLVNNCEETWGFNR